MLEKRFIFLLNQYQKQMKNLKLTPIIIQKIQYIKDCLDHLENEIDDLKLDSSKEENKIYKQMEKDLGPLILAYIVNNFN